MNKQEFLELATQCEWKKLVSRKSPMLWRNLEDKGYTREIIVQYTGIDTFIAWKKDEYILYCNPDHFANASVKLKALVMERSNLFDDIATKCYSLCDDYLEFCKKHRFTSFEKYSLQELRDVFVEYVNKNIAIVAFRPVVLMLDNLIVALISEEIAKYENVDFRYELIIPKKDLPFMAQQKDILNIGYSMEKSGLSDTQNLRCEIEDMINSHIEKFGWVFTHRYLGDSMKREDVIENINQCLGTCGEKITAMQQERELKNAKLETIKTLSERLKDLIETSQEYAYLRTFRMDAAIEGDFYLRSFFFEIAKRVGLEYNELIYLTTDEIVGLLSQEMTAEILRDVVRKRHEYFATFLVNDNEIYNFEGIEYKEPVKNISSDSTAITGKVAQQGRITGTVKVVRFKEEIGKVNDGDIIVSPMTTPEMIGGLMKCAGIITDEGGIASHAAQISREFKIPCIIGTNNASSILKDGDTVEIVAEGLDGTITRLISRKLPMNILVVENQEKDYEDIKACLPIYMKHQHKETIMDCEPIVGTFDTWIIGGLFKQCQLLISDIIPIDGTDLNLDSQDAFDYFSNGMKTIARVHKKLGGSLIIITKMPVPYIIKYFKAMREDIEIQELFSNDMADLEKQLRTNDRSQFQLYKRNGIQILTKPYNRERKNFVDIEIWQDDLRALLEEIYSDRDLTI